jgi:NAD(P)H dehydrogenase (quinone)
MEILIVLAHPERQSFNGAMFRTAVETLAAAGHEVKTSDLHAMQFDPVSGRHNFLSAKDPDYFKQQIEEMHATETYGFAGDIEDEIQKIEWCDLMIWQLPLWWFSLPGILKGWVDRVFAMGRTYGGSRIYANGVFRGKRAMLSLTTGSPAAAYVKGGFNGDIYAILSRSSAECSSSSVLRCSRRRWFTDLSGWSKAKGLGYWPLCRTPERHRSRDAV